MRKFSLVYLNFLLSFVIGTLVYVASKLKIRLPDWIQFYLNDFLITPIVLTICLVVIRRSRGNKTYIIPIGYILYLCCLYSCIFEFYLPTFHVRYTYDKMDILLYFLGGLWFWILQRIDQKDEI